MIINLSRWNIPVNFIRSSIFSWRISGRFKMAA